VVVVRGGLGRGRGVAVVVRGGLGRGRGVAVVDVVDAVLVVEEVDLVEVVLVVESVDCPGSCANPLAGTSASSTPSVAASTNASGDGRVRFRRERLNGGVGKRGTIERRVDGRYVRRYPSASSDSTAFWTSASRRRTAARAKL
jgi:hypothetical protein